MHFSIGEAWSQAMQFLRENLRMLLLYVGLPAVLFPFVQRLIVGESGAEAMLQSGNTDPLVALQAMSGGNIALTLAFAVVSGGLTFAAYRLGLGHREAPGSVIGWGMTAMALTILALIVLLLPLMILLGLLSGGALMAGAGAGLAALGLLLVPVLIWLFTRIVLTQPAMADARSANPLYGIAQSWRLTAPVQWRVLGYVLLLIVVGFVLALLLAAVTTLFAGAGIVGELLANLLLTAPFSILMVAIYAGLYRAIGPSRTSEVFA